MDLKNNIEITTFINPHLFWIIIKDEERSQALNNLNKQMKEICKTTSNHKLEIGEIVAAKINKKLYRATIEDIETENKQLYLVWLIDYGTMRESETVFKLPPELRRTPALSLQASLHNVSYVEQLLKYDEYGQLASVTKPTLTPTPLARQACTKFISNAHNFKFKCEKREDGIEFGDVYFQDKDNNEVSLRKALIDDGVIVEGTLEGMTDFICTYKESHLLAISKICSNEPYPLDAADEIDMESCINIVSKILEEFDYNEVLSFEDEVSKPLWSLNRSKNDTITSLDTTVSDSETPNRSKSKKQRLKETFLKYKNSEKSSPSNQQNASDLTDDSTSEHYSNTSGSKAVSTSKIKRLCQQMKEMKQQKLKLANTDTSHAKTNRHIIFTAAGAERAFPIIISKRNEKKSPKRYYSSEDSSNEYNIYTNKTFKPSDPILPQDQNISSSTVTHKNEENSISDNSSNAKTKDDDEKTSSVGDSSTSQEHSFNDPPPVSRMKIKPHCSCKQCNVWTKEEEIFIDKLPKHGKVDKLVGVNNQLLFKENEKMDSEVHICSVDYAYMKKVDKQSMKKLLVHSESILNPVDQVSKVAFERNIHQNLYRLDYREPKRIQQYAWPAIFRNQHVFMINGKQTGKTLAYLPVMCTFILEKHDRYDSLLKVAGGPIVIILCSDTRKCEDIFDLTKVIMGNNKSYVSLVTYPLAHINTSHTDLLITTPPILVELLKNKSVNFKRLCHLILENGDTILKKYKDPMKAIFDLTQSMLKNRMFTKALQLIVCSEHYNSQIRSLITRLQQIPVICIGNYLEAALYGKLEFLMKFRDSAVKEQELKFLLKDSHRINRSIVICEEEEVEDIHEILTLKGIDNIPITKSMCLEDMLHYENVWTEAKSGAFSVLICSDFVLDPILTITCATTLIHYSLPKSWSKFLKRFCCLLENCHSPLDSKETKIESKSVVLCDENCKEQMYRFFSYINCTELKKQLTEEKVQRFSETLKNELEKQKLDREIGLCGDLKLFGKCFKERCERRHLINEDLDISEYLPKSGKIKFKIVNITDVTSFSIKLLQHVDHDNKIHEFEEIANITEDLTTTLRLSRKKIFYPTIGHLYAFYNMDEQEGNYHRCEILNVENDSVQIKLIDKGTNVSTMKSRLFRLPKEFDCDSKPRAIIDAILANYVPPYQDENFSAKSFFNVKTLIEKLEYKDIIFTGEVHLQLDNTLWLNDVSEEVVLSDRIIPGFQLSREILIKKLVEPDPNQLDNLYKLCLDAGITVPKFKKPQVNVPLKKQKVNLQWAHLDADNINEVTFSAAFSPDEVYVRLNKFSNLLYTLQKEIQVSIKKPYYPKLDDVNEGDVCLAVDSVSQEYCRVMVLRKELDKVLCFFLDFGDEAVVPIDELKFIQPSLINKLPFQCIQCRLFGIKPFSEKWEEDVTNVLYEYAHEPGTDIFRSLFLKVCGKEESTSICKTKYSVVLKDGFGETNVLINKLLVDCGLVVNKIDEDITDFEIPPLHPESPELDEDLEEIAYICRKTNELDQQLQPNDNVKNGEVDDSQDVNLDEMELFIFGDPLDFFAQLKDKNDYSTPTRKNELPAIVAAPQVDYCTPDVYWSQTQSHIKLSIKLIDVKDYKLTLTKGRILSFRTVNDQKTYCLKMMFYELVETLQHSPAGPELRITLNKIKHMDWPRLILSKQKARNIHYDVMKITTTEDENRKLLQLPKELDIEDDDEFNENDPMYVVESDLDSDLDLDLEYDSD